MGSTTETRESVRAHLGGPQAWRGQCRCVYESERPVAVLSAELDRDGREVFLDAYAIGPQARLLQRTLLELGIDATRSLAAADDEQVLPPDGDEYAMSAAFWQVLAGAGEQDEGYQEVLQDIGFRPIRRFWRMVRDLSDCSATEAPAPTGVARRVVAGDDDRRLLHSVFRESFAEHFGMTHEDRWEDWITKLLALPGSDPSRWWIAELDGQPVGLCILDDSKAEFDEGYVRTLGVIPSARGRGIARWLLRCAAADSVSRGRAGIALSVDGENTTGATALYESEGYVTREAIDVFCYPLIGEVRLRRQIGSRANYRN